MRGGRLSRFHLLTAAMLLVCVVAPWRLCAVVAAVYVAVIALGVTFPCWQLFLPVICRGRTDRRAVALTFDDGPDPSVTPLVLETLREAQVRATFFCVGERAARHPELVRQIVAEGHLVGNHGQSHSRRTNLFSTGRLRAELQRCQEVLTQAGQTPKFFRPPMGLTNPRVACAVRELGLTAVGWSCGGHDQTATEAGAVVRRVRAGLKPGAIILLHDGGTNGTVLVAALTRLLAELRREGYELCRLDELLSV